MKREEVTEKQENLLRNLEPYQNYRALLLLDEAQKEQWQKWNHSVRLEKMHTLDTHYKNILFTSQKEEWQKKITQIVFSDRIPSKRVLQNAGTEICKDVSEAEDGSILGWVEKAGDTEIEYILHLDAYGTILAPENSTSLFYGFENVKTIDWGNCFSTQNVTDMNWMFDGCSQLERLDVSGFDTQNVTDMHAMFSGCSQLESLNVSGFNTQNVRSMSGMFNGCKELVRLDVSGFATQNVKNMSWMFRKCTKLEYLDVSHFDTQNVTDMHGMFDLCMKLASLDVSGFATQNVTNMSWMFKECSRLEKLDVSGFDTQNVTDMREMFDGCTSLPASAKRVGKKGLFHSLKSFLKG